jgi:hypothetical protein
VPGASNLQISPRAELQIHKELFALSIPQVTSCGYAVFQSVSFDDRYSGRDKWNTDEHASPHGEKLLFSTRGNVKKSVFVEVFTTEFRCRVR